MAPQIPPLAVAVMSAFALSCASVTEATPDEIAAVLAADGVAFPGDTIPDAVLDYLAAYPVIVVGEQHHLREHYRFVATLLSALHARGYRQLLVEWPHMADWLLGEYVRNAPGLSWEPPESLGREMLAAIRAFNAGRTASDQLRVRAIDLNLDGYGGAASFRDLLQLRVRALGSAGPVAAFLAAPYGTADEQQVAIGELDAALRSGQAALAATWGGAGLAAVQAMVARERQSVVIRAWYARDDDRATPAREAAIMELADACLAGAAGTVVNVGSTHAQKRRLYGTDTEWLGDYLTHRSPVAQGRVVVVDAVAARVILEAGSGGTAYDVRVSSPPNELFRLMAETWPARTVFLPLTDSLFGRDGVVINVEDVMHRAALREHFDVIVQYPVAHRVPID